MVPYFDRPDLLRHLVGSVLEQADPQWRLTVVDDGPGLDGVENWLGGLGDTRLRYLRNPANLGINRNFQRCLDLAEQDFVVITGADDLFLPNYVGSVRAAYRKFPEAAIIQPGVAAIDAAGAVRDGLADRAKRGIFAPRVQVPTLLRGEDLAVSLLRGNWLYFPSLAWRTRPAQETGFRDGLHVIQDLALVLDLIRSGRQLLVEPVASFRYRRHSSSVSSWRAADGSRFAEERGFFREEAARLDELGWRRAARAARRHVASRVNAATQLPGALAGGRVSRARALAAHVLRP